jgi:ribosomal protein S25
MIKELKEQGFNDGFAAAKEAKKSGMKKKDIMNKVVVDDKEVAKQIMKDVGVGHQKAFSFACVYAMSYDNGVREAIFSDD